MNNSQNLKSEEEVITLEKLVEHLKKLPPVSPRMYDDLWFVRVKEEESDNKGAKY
jgi:hypothetical protein